MARDPPLPNSAIEWFFLRWRRSHMGEGLCLLNGEGASLSRSAGGARRNARLAFRVFRVPLAEPDGTLGWPFGSFVFRWRSQAERSVCLSGLSRSAGEARRSARVAFRVPPRSADKVRRASPHPWRVLPPGPVRGRMPPIPRQVAAPPCRSARSMGICAAISASIAGLGPLPGLDYGARIGHPVPRGKGAERVRRGKLVKKRGVWYNYAFVKGLAPGAREEFTWPSSLSRLKWNAAR